MHKYQVSRILEVFNGHSFESVIDLGMGVYLKKNVILDKIHSPCLNSSDENEIKYALSAKEKLSFYLRKKPIYLIVNEYDNETIHAEVYSEMYDQSINDLMFIGGYVWEKRDNADYKVWVLNYPSSIL